MRQRDDPIKELKQISDSLDKLVGNLQYERNVECLLREIKDLLQECCGKRPSLGGFVAAVHGRRTPMAVSVPVPQLLDVEQIVLSVMPRKADGHVDTAAVISWVSSDPSQVGASPGRIVNGVLNTDPFDFLDPQFGETVSCPGAFNCVATTPLTSGTATVTASSPGYESADFGPITYAPGVPRSLNASVGLPISDLPTP